MPRSGGVQTLLRREIPDGDPGAIFERALALLLEDILRERAAATPDPRLPRATATRSRHIPGHVKREVWERDGGRCAFVARNGRRCREEAFVEYHHVHPYALGGPTSVDNIVLRCRAHDIYEAEIDFGVSGPSCPKPGLVSKRVAPPATAPSP